MPDAQPAGVELADAAWTDVDQVEALERASFPTPWRRDFFESELEGEGRFNRVARAVRAGRLGR